MKKFNLLMTLACFLLFGTSCQKDEIAPTIIQSSPISPRQLSNEKSLINANSPSIDNELWELFHLYDLLSSIKKDNLTSFLKEFGYPAWNSSTQKRSNEVTITSVPMINGIVITGIIKMYETNDGRLKIHFFPKYEIDNAIEKKLDTQQFHIFKGVIQSLILSSIHLDINIDNKYLEWLEKTENRIDEKVKYFCIEEWDCTEYVASINGWSAIDFETSNNSISFGAPEKWCKLIFRECWTDFTPRVFPNYWSSGGSENINWTNSGGGNESSAVRNAKTAFLKNWLEMQGINIDDGTFDALQECLSYLPIPNNQILAEDVYINDSDCISRELGNSIADKLEIDENSDEMDCLRNGELSLQSELLNLLDGEVIDPCDTDKSTEDNINDALTNACQNSNGSLTLDDFLLELEKTDKIHIQANLEDECPKLKCVLDNMINDGLGSEFICNLFDPFEEEDSPVHIIFKAVDFTAPTFDPNGLALAQVNSQNPDYIFIKVNSSKCEDSNLVDIFETLQHEFIHATIKSLLISEYGYLPIPDAPISYQQAFDNLLIERYGEEPGQDEHSLMISHFTDQAVQSLIQMNNGMGTEADFIGLVLNGFPRAILIAAGYDIPTVEEQARHALDYINNPDNIINETLLGCN